MAPPVPQQAPTLLYSMFNLLVHPVAQSLIVAIGLLLLDSCVSIHGFTSSD